MREASSLLPHCHMLRSLQWYSHSYFADEHPRDPAKLVSPTKMDGDAASRTFAVSAMTNNRRIRLIVSGSQICRTKPFHLFDAVFLGRFNVVY